MDAPPILRSSAFLRFLRYPDSKPIYIDPSMVVEVGPGAVTHEGSPDWTAVKLYALGGTAIVKGDPEYVAVVIQRARDAAAEVGLGVLVQIVQEEVQRAADIKSSLN